MSPPALGATLLAVSGGLAATAFWLTARPPRRPGPLAFGGFMAGWLASELAPQLATLVALIAAAGIACDGLASQIGWLGLALAPLSLPAVLKAPRDAARALDLARAALSLDVPRPPARPLWAWPLFFVFAARGVTRATVAYGPDRAHRLDLWRRDAEAPARPPRGRLIYVHGGGWVLGFRRWQGRLLFRRLVADGWEVASVGYRLAPRATWPEPLDDVRRAIAWLDAHWPSDSTPTLLAGNSAGAHLASRLALAADGWPHTRRPLAGCVAWYGVHDLLDRHGHWPHGSLRLLWERLIAKRPLRDAPDLFSDASPLTHALAAASSGHALPPTLLIHGAADTLVPPEESRALAAAHPQAVLVEVPGAQHAFDVLWSSRALASAAIAACWLEAAADRAQAPASEPE
jgi:acetyl esterase/lipase